MADSSGADAAFQFRATTIGETEQFLDGFSAAFRLNRDAAPRSAIRSHARPTDPTNLLRPTGPPHPAHVAPRALLHGSVTRPRPGARYGGTIRWRVMHELLTRGDSFVVDGDGRIDRYVHI